MPVHTNPTDYISAHFQELLLYWVRQPDAAQLHTGDGFKGNSSELVFHFHIVVAITRQWSKSEQQRPL